MKGLSDFYSLEKVIKALFNHISRRGAKTAISTPKSNDTELKKIYFPYFTIKFKKIIGRVFHSDYGQSRSSINLKWAGIKSPPPRLRMYFEGTAGRVNHKFLRLI